MKISSRLLYLITALCLHTSLAQADTKRSLLDNDPNVVYLSEHIDRRIELLVAKPAKAYATKEGKRRLGVYPVNTKVELIAITDKAYRVKGKASHAGVTGWVDPNLLASKDKDFIANLKKLYERQIVVKQLITDNEVAIGMTLDEVKQSIGEPTESEVKQTRQGESGTWAFVVTEEQKHYRTVFDRSTGRSFRQLSHITTEEKSRTTLEFENSTVTTVTRKRSNGPGNTKIIPAPLTFRW